MICQIYLINVRYKQANNGNVFEVGGSTLTLNTNNQSGHIWSIGKWSNGIPFQLQLKNYLSV